jgi:hypothetical protein
MITDRVSTCGFLVIVSHLYPSYTFQIVMLIVLDIASHWFHVLRYSKCSFQLPCHTVDCPNSRLFFRNRSQSHFRKLRNSRICDLLFNYFPHYTRSPILNVLITIYYSA